MPENKKNGVASESSKPSSAPDVLETETGVAAQQTSVDAAGAEAFIAEKRIGERIKRLRLKRSMGLVELGRKTGLSASFLSQLETGRVVPTLRNLARIAMVFNKDLLYFFDAEPQPVFRIHRRKDRMRQPQSGVENPTYYFESMGYMVPDRQLDPYLAEFLPLTKPSEVKPHVHPGFEFLYVLAGELEIQHADKTHVVEAGDGVYFDASSPHAYRCHGASSAQVIIVTMHQGQAQQAQNTLRTLNVPRSLGAPLSGSGLAAKSQSNQPPMQNAHRQSDGAAL